MNELHGLSASVNTTQQLLQHFF